MLQKKIAFFYQKRFYTSITSSKTIFAE